VLKLNVHVICDCDCDKEVNNILISILAFLHNKFWDLDRLQCPRVQWSWKSDVWRVPMWWWICRFVILLFGEFIYSIFNFLGANCECESEGESAIALEAKCKKLVDFSH
jgi:hypothetical protein